MTTNTKWSFATILAALAAFFGGHATAPSTPPPGPTKDTTVVVVGPSQPVTGTVLAHDDFTTYTTTADLMARVTANVQGGTGRSNLLYTDGRNAQLASIDESVQYNGHHTMKYSQLGGTDASPELWAGLSSQQAHVWIKAVIRFVPGWTTTGTGQTPGDNGQLVSSSAAYKLLGWGYDNGTVYGSGRIEITNGTEYQNYWSVAPKGSSGGKAGCNSHDQGSTTRVNTEWTDGQWYVYIIEIDNTQKTGVTRLYLGKGSEKPMLKLTCTAAMSDGSMVPGPNTANFGMNYNQVRNVGQDLSLNYGEWDVVSGADPFGLK